MNLKQEIEQQSDALREQLTRAASGLIETSTGKPVVLYTTSGPGEPTTLIVCCMLVPNSDVEYVKGVVGGAVNQCVSKLASRYNVAQPRRPEPNA